MTMSGCPTQERSAPISDKAALGYCHICLTPTIPDESSASRAFLWPAPVSADDSNVDERFPGLAA